MRWRLAVLLALWSATLAWAPRAPAAHLRVDPHAAGLILQPPLLAVEGCNGLAQARTFQLANNTGAAGTFDLTYLVSAGDATLTGPPHISLEDGQATDFEVVLTPGLCVAPGDQVHARLEASGNGWTSLAEIAQVVVTDPHWELARDHPLACFDWLVETAVDPGDGQEYAYVAGCDTRNTYRYDPRAGTWTTLAATLPDYLWEAGDGVAFQGRIYARSDGQGSLKRQLYVYDVGSGAWSSGGVPPGIADRSFYEAVELGGQVYFMGGLDRALGTFSDAVDRYDPDTGTWTEAAPMLHPRALAAAWVYMDRIYVAGGLNVDGALSSTEVYDPATGAWTENPALFASLPAPRYGAGDAVLDGRLWLAGGFDTADSDETLYWLPADNAWHPGPSLAAAARHLEGTVLAGDLYMVGGRQGDYALLDYNQHLVVCPDRSECQGWLQGQVYDAELPETTPACTAPSLSLTPGGSVPVAPLTGHYGPLPLLPGAYLLEADAPGYSLEPAAVTVEDGLTTTRNIGLWRPRVAAAPAGLQVASGPGAYLTAPLWITNTGHLALEYRLVELAPSTAGNLSVQTDELPWVWASPGDGEIAASQAATVELTFGCTTVQDGQVLSGTLRLLHSDPCAAPLDLRLEFSCGDRKSTIYLPLLLLGGDPGLSGSPRALTETASRTR